jgi:hypothetical protein
MAKIAWRKTYISLLTLAEEFLNSEEAEPLDEVTVKDFILWTKRRVSDEEHKRDVSA